MESYGVPHRKQAAQCHSHYEDAIPEYRREHEQLRSNILLTTIRILPMMIATVGVIAWMTIQQHVAPSRASTTL